METISPSHVVLPKDEFEKIEKQLENYEQVLNSKLIIQKVEPDLINYIKSVYFRTSQSKDFPSYYEYLSQEDYAKEFTDILNRNEKLQNKVDLLMKDNSKYRAKLGSINSALHVTFIGKLFKFFNKTAFDKISDNLD